MAERFPFDKTPKYLSVTLDCTISYHQHLLNIEVKVTKYCHLLKRLSSSNYGGDSQLRVLLSFLFIFLLLNTAVQYGVKAITAKKSTHL